MKKEMLLKKLRSGGLDQQLVTLYGDDEKTLSRQRARIEHAIGQFDVYFPGREDISLFSAPGRTEIGGNHTDHQHGCALAAAVDLDVIAVVAFHDEGIIRLKSKGHDMGIVELDDLIPRPGEKGKSVSMIRGIAARFAQRGITVGGFDAYTVSDVLSGSGLSSSAAFETLVATIIDTRYNDGKTPPVELAKIGQFAENQYYGKGSGLLDQTACAVGGLVFLDFKDTENPVVKKQQFDLAAAGYRLCVTDTKGSHGDLEDEYTAVPEEMRSVARQFGKEVLREVDEDAFYQRVPELVKSCSDRAILRASHFFRESKRAEEEARALEEGDLDRFFTLYRQSALSSAILLQNLYSVTNPTQQGITLGIMMSRRVLGDDAAVRVHGGGFAGTVQAFVPVDRAEEYARVMDSIFGENNCSVLRVRPFGGVRITE